MDKYRDTEIVSAEVREITPTMAKEMLHRNQGNRKLDQGKIMFYYHVMRDGSWKMTHQGIALSEDGNIIDGQHRLAAVANSGNPVKFLVTTIRAKDGRGMLTAIGQPIDIGKLRSVSDIISEPPEYVTIAKTMLRDYMPNGKEKSQDPEIVSACISKLRPSLDSLKAVCGVTRKGLSIATIRTIMVIRHYNGVDLYEMYKDSLNLRYERLPKSWVSWATRIYAMAESTNRVPRNLDYRKYLGAITWQVTDPDKGHDQVVVVKNIDRYIDIISGEVSAILFDSVNRK